MKEKLKNLSISLRLLIIALVIFVIIYSGAIGIIGQALWREKTEGSLIRENNEVIGSRLIGQEFNSPVLFHSRPSSIEYNATKSGSKNLGPQTRVLFSIKSDNIKDDLNQGIIPEKLKNKFENIEKPLPEDATVIKPKEDKWEIKDGEELYTIKTEDGKLDIYPKSELSERVENILRKIAETHESENLEVPSDLVTESGSALDPHITVQAAMFQIPRIIKNTNGNISEKRLEKLVKKHSKGKLFGIYGMKRVNVLKINIDLLKILEGKNIG